MRKLALLLILAFGTAWAQQPFPSKPLRIVVPFPAGGTTDIVARLVAQRMSESMGQTVVVENRAGAGGTIGAAEVAKAAPDGYTLLVYSSGIVINPAMHKTLPYDTEKDFTPITNLVSNGGLFFAVANNVPAKSLQEFLDYAKKPGTQIAYSTPGIGNTWHLAMEVFNGMTGIKSTHIPYKGGGPATAALAGGEVQAMFASPAPLMPHYKSGRVRVLAWTGATRHPALPEVPTTAEAGLAQYRHDGGWFALFGPAGLPSGIAEKLANEVRKAMQDPGVRDRMQKIGVFPVADSPAEFKKFYLSEIKTYTEQARLAGIRPE